MGLPEDRLERLIMIASLNGIKVQPMQAEQSRKEKRDAVVYPTTNGWNILYNPNRPKARIVFTIAHEIVHTFFPNNNGARFRSMTNPESREANELELLCHLGASELAMPLNEFQKISRGQFNLVTVSNLACHFGTSFEATVYRLATAHPGLAVAGTLQYRYRKEEERELNKAANQRNLFSDSSLPAAPPIQRKYRRQSIHLSSACSEEYTIRFNKSFDVNSVVYQLQDGLIHTGIEQLPNLSGANGRIEAMPCPYQRETANKEFGDVFFFWEQF